MNIGFNLSFSFNLLFIFHKIYTKLILKNKYITIFTELFDSRQYFKPIIKDLVLLNHLNHLI